MGWNLIIKSMESHNISQACCLWWILPHTFLTNSWIVSIINIAVPRATYLMIGQFGSCWRETNPTTLLTPLDSTHGTCFSEFVPRKLRLDHRVLSRTNVLTPNLCQIAAQTAAPFNPNVHITPIHGNIKEPQFDIEWFQRFDIVLNALDNLGEIHFGRSSYDLLTWLTRALDARRHVNKMCMAAQVPLVESGTAGYLGQVQPLLKVISFQRSPFHFSH